MSIIIDPDRDAYYEWMIKILDGELNEMRIRLARISAINDMYVRKIGKLEKENIDLRNTVKSNHWQRCETCSHFHELCDVAHVSGDCETCPLPCMCKHCRNGSNWEWRDTPNE